MQNTAPVWFRDILKRLWEWKALYRLQEVCACLKKCPKQAKALQGQWSLRQTHPRLQTTTRPRWGRISLPRNVTRVNCFREREDPLAERCEFPQSPGKSRCSCCSGSSPGVTDEEAAMIYPDSHSFKSVCHERHLCTWESNNLTQMSEGNWGSNPLKHKASPELPRAHPLIWFIPIPPWLWTKFLCKFSWEERTP